MTAGTLGAPSPLAPLVDESRLGSPAGQALTGIAGIVLAIILVMGQISLATTKGLATHLDSSVQHITDGNAVMESVIERAAPSVALEKLVAEQAKIEANTLDTMQRTNGEMTAIAETTTELDSIVGRMEAASGSLATGVSGMSRDTTKIVDLLGTMPAATDRTQKALDGINRDTTATNIELGAIAGKMQKYGLPRAQGAPSP